MIAASYSTALKLNGFIPLTVALGVFLATTSSANAKGPEVLETVGLRIGQSQDEVAAAINAFDPNLKIQQVMWSPQPGVPKSLSALYASSPPMQFGSMDAYAEYVQATFGQATGKTYFVVRRSGELSKTKVTTEAVIEALVKKYGPPTARVEQKDIGIVRLHWTYKKDGSPAPVEQCQHPDFGNFFVSQLNNTRPSEGCGVTAMASIASVLGRPIARGYQVAIFSHQDFLQDIRAIQKLKEGHSQGVKKKDIETATDKPKI